MHHLLDSKIMKNRHLICILMKSKQVGHRCKMGTKLPTPFPPTTYILYYCRVGFFYISPPCMPDICFTNSSLFGSLSVCNFFLLQQKKLLSYLSWERILRFIVKKWCGCSYLNGAWKFPVAEAWLSHNWKLCILFYCGLTLQHMLCTTSMIAQVVNHHFCSLALHLEYYFKQSFHRC